MTAQKGPNALGEFAQSEYRRGHSAALQDLYDRLHKNRCELNAQAADVATPNNMRGPLFDRAGGIEAAAAVVTQMMQEGS